VTDHAAEEHAEQAARRWRQHPHWGSALDKGRLWRENASPRELAGFGRPARWTDGQDYALAQLRAHMWAGDLVRVEVELAAAPSDARSVNATVLRAALRGQAQLFGDVDGGHHLLLHGEFSRRVTQAAEALIRTDPEAPRGCPSSIPLRIGDASPAVLLGELYAANGVAWWPADSQRLAVMVTWPCGHRLREQIPHSSPR
jgi:hypothetical protein